MRYFKRKAVGKQIDYKLIFGVISSIGVLIAIYQIWNSFREKVVGVINVVGHPKATHSASWYGFAADNIHLFINSVSIVDKPQKAADIIINDIRNQDDWDLLKKAWGIRDLHNFGFKVFSGDLETCLRYELNAQQIMAIQSSFDWKGIKW